MPYELQKVFDCQEMPDNVRKAFFDYYRDNGKGNDVYVRWFGSYSDEWLDADGEMMPEYKPIHDWLVANGAEPNEDVIINHWW